MPPSPPTVPLFAADNGFSREKIDRALCVVEPSLVAFMGMSKEDLDPSAANELRHLVLTARVKVRRVIAALNGVNIDDDIPASNAVQWKDAPAILDKDTVKLLKRCLLDDKVVAAIEATVGEDDAAEMLGAISTL